MWRVWCSSFDRISPSYSFSNSSIQVRFWSFDVWYASIKRYFFSFAHQRTPLLCSYPIFLHYYAPVSVGRYRDEIVSPRFCCSIFQSKALRIWTKTSSSYTFFFSCHLISVCLFFVRIAFGPLYFFVCAFLPERRDETCWYSCYLHSFLPSLCLWAWNSSFVFNFQTELIALSV